MKIIKTASGKKLKISKKEWTSIGKKAGWTKEAQEINNDSPAEDLINAVENAIANLKFYDVGTIKEVEKKTGSMKNAIKLLRDFVVSVAKREMDIRGY